MEEKEILTETSSNKTSQETKKAQGIFTEAFNKLKKHKLKIILAFLALYTFSVTMDIGRLSKENEELRNDLAQAVQLLSDIKAKSENQ